jgi:serine/threonine-protein kinase RsbW
MNDKIKMVRRLDERTVEISLPNKVGYERIAMACCASFARMIGFVPERIEDLKSAVAEACINAMQHGNKWRPEARVVVNMNFRDDTFTVSVMDQGDGMPEVPEYRRGAHQGARRLHDPATGGSSEIQPDDYRRACCYN